MRYEQAVTEARRLVRRSEDDQWRLAELTWEQLSAGKTGREWGADVGLSHVYVDRIFRVWEKWIFGNQVTKDQSRPRFADAVRQAMGLPAERSESREMEAVSRLGKMTPQRRTEVARDLLADPAVAREIRDSVTAAGGRIESPAEFEERTRSVPLEAVTAANDHARAWASILGRLGAVIEDARQLDPPSEETMAALRSCALGLLDLIPERVQ